MLSYRVVNVFTEQRFGGNPLAVVMNGELLSRGQMQAVAREFNLSETVFMLPSEHADAAMRLRIFTPWQELPFARHPIIGAACVLGMLGLVPPGCTLPFGLQTPGGVVAVQVSASMRERFEAQLETPQVPVFGPCFEDLGTAAAALQLDLSALAGHPHPARTVSCGLPMLLLPLRGPEHLAGIEVDRARLASLLQSAGAHSLYVYASGYENRWRCRMFNPQLGEDPATGSAAAALAAHLADLQGGEADWSAEVSQGMEMQRPSLIQVRALCEQGRVRSVQVGGQVVPAMEGHLYVD